MAWIVLKQSGDSGTESNRERAHKMKYKRNLFYTHIYLMKLQQDTAQEFSLQANDFGILYWICP